MRKFLLESIQKTISKWTERDIYALSLFVYDDEDNPCKPTVTLGYNTEQAFRENRADASDELEARWNYAFWLQNEEFVFGKGRTRKYVKQWLAENNFPNYSDKQIEAMELNDVDKLECITLKFVETLIGIVQELHSTGFIRQKFGKDIPVIIHELEYYDTIAEQNLRANPPELVEDFAKFCRGE